MIPDGDRIDRETARATLQRRRRRIVEDLRTRSARLRDETPRNLIDADSDAVDGYDLDATLIEIATATLHHIDGALNRLDIGQYGWCTRCHRRIAASRLRAMPFAVRCRECEAARETETPIASSVLRYRSRPEMRR